jgi:hypothetical membrane protein
MFTRNPGAIAGILLFLAGSIALMGIITAESFYPASPTAYTTANSEISDLGATRPPYSIITQPSATIFNGTMIVTGILTLLGGFFAHQTHRKLLVSVPFWLFGLGILGVGIFPGNNAVIHPIFALLTFVMGGIAAITSAIILPSPFRYIAALFGLIALFCLFFSSLLFPILGDGGTERWVAYPIILWVIGLGGYYAGAYQTRTN